MRNTNATDPRKSFAPKLKALASVIAYVLAANQARANPLEPVVIAGEGSFAAQGTGTDQDRQFEAVLSIVARLQ